MSYVLFASAAVLLPHLPEGLGYRLFGWIGDLLGVAAPRIRRRVAANLAQALGEPRRRKSLAPLTRASLRNLCWNYYELFRGSAWEPERLPLPISVVGADHVEEAHRGGRGAILLFAHVGALEALTHLPPLYPQYKFVTLVERMKDHRMHVLMRRARTRHGLEVVPLDALLRAVRLLRRNSLLVVAADRDMTASGVLVPFFGSLARFPVGAVGLALRHEVPVMLMYAWREHGPRGAVGFRVHVEPPFAFQRSGDLREDTRAGVAIVAEALESVIRTHPDQWLANYSFWS